ncbi:MAG: hypothetical protein ACRDI2_15965, partial [Chloroflexota bacterium]
MGLLDCRLSTGGGKPPAAADPYTRAATSRNPQEFVEGMCREGPCADGAHHDLLALDGPVGP